MIVAPAKSQSGMRWAVTVCAVAGVVLFQFFGNATRGYIATSSLFWWWISHWLDPQAETQHGWLILGISAWLFWRNLRTAGRASFQPAPPWNGYLDTRAISALILALLLHALGFIAQQTRLSILAALLLAWGMVRLAGGKRWGDAAAFPLAFMVFAIPLNVLDSIGFWLRLWVIDASEWIAHAAGIDVARNGTQLLSPDGHFQYDVAAACSGVRSLVALSALSLLVGYLNFRSWPRRALIFLLCFPLTYLGNVVRIGSIILAGRWGGPVWAERAHDVMGFGVFAIVLGGVLGAAELVRFWWPEKSDGDRRAALEEGDCVTPLSSARPGESGARPSHSIATVWMPTLFFVALAAGEMFFLAHVAASPARGAAGVRLTADGVNPVELPAFIGTDWIGRRMDVTAIEREILPADTGFSRRNYVLVQDAAHSVFVSIVLSGRDRTSIHRPEICLVGQGWTIASASAYRFSFPGQSGRKVPATLLHTVRIERFTHRRVPALVAYWFVSSDQVVATHWQRLMSDAWKRLRYGQADRWAYVLLQADAGDGDEAALARMQAVLDGTLPVFEP